MAREITTRELKGMIDRGKDFTIVNTLVNDAYEKEHICGSINIPLNYIEGDARSVIGRDETVVVHCSGPGCPTSGKAADILEGMGYRNVLRYWGGMEEWKLAGYCTEGKAGYRRVA